MEKLNKEDTDFVYQMVLKHNCSIKIVNNKWHIPINKDGRYGMWFNDGHWDVEKNHDKI